MRFGLVARTLTSLCYLTQMIMYMGIVVYAPALVLKSIMNLSESWAILLVGIVCTFYSSLGGMKAVILADLFQSFIMFFALFSIIYTETSRRNGFSEIFRVAEENGRINLLNFSVDPTERHTWFSLIIGGGFTFMSLYAVNQIQVQRYFTMKDLKTAQRSLWLQWPILTLLSLTTSFTGLCIYSRYATCDPILSGRINRADELMPQYVKDTMNEVPGVAGIFVAGILSASLTTVSSCLNSIAAIIVEDYVKPMYIIFKKRNLPKEGCLPLTKLLSVTLGVVSIAMAFITRNVNGILQTSLSIFGAVGGPLLGIFTLGMFIPVSNQKGAVSGIVLGLIASLTLSFGGQKLLPQRLPLSQEGCGNTTKPHHFNLIASNKTSENEKYFYLYRISYLWYIVIGFTVTIVLGLIISLITKSDDKMDKNMESDLFSPVITRRTRRQDLKKSSTGNIKIGEISSTHL